MFTSAGHSKQLETMQAEQVLALSRKPGSQSVQTELSVAHCKQLPTEQRVQTPPERPYSSRHELQTDGLVEQSWHFTSEQGVQEDELARPKPFKQAVQMVGEVGQ